MRFSAVRVAYLLAGLTGLAAAALQTQTPTKADSAAEKAYWQAIANNAYKPPTGETAAKLSPRLSALLGSPDPDLRDEIAYTTFVHWIYQERLLSNGEMRPLIAEWLGNLSRNIGSLGTDAVLLRSFSALMLSVVAARDNAAPFLEEREFRQILASALAYADAEKDLRGFDAGKGWMHSAAHTADLLKFLGRSRYLTRADQAAILAAVSRKLRSATVVFSFGEDERLARAVLSIVARADFDADGFHTWLRSSKPEPPTGRPDLADLRTFQNLKNMLAKLDVLLISGQADTSNEKEAAASVQETLKGTF